MHLLLVFSDPLVGRFDRDSLPPQALMELLLQNCSAKDSIIPVLSEINDIADGDSLTTGDSREVVSIIWTARNLDGSFPFVLLPSSLEELILNVNRLDGSLSVSDLPRGLRTFSVEVNRLSGSLDLTCLPETIQLFNVAHNEFSGEIDLTHLPTRIERVFLNFNQFFGHVDFGHLPQSLRYLSLTKNTYLSGEVTEFHGKYLKISGTQIVDARDEG
mmetsp:Transcript_7516/g.11317  ORF Transcript_7516/g.11317 Transcript_7516/m.11317 type:complete len:216 (-) Transcript_7516:23-670(-)